MVNCQFENHEKNNIIAVCFNPGCSQRRLVCFQCIIQHHSNHNNDLKELDKLEDLKNNQPKFYEEFQNHYNLVQQYINQFKLILSSMQTDFNQSFKNLNYKQLESDIQKLCCFDKVKDQIQNTIKEISKQIMSLFPTFKSVFKMLKTMNEGQPKLAQQVEQTQIVLSFSQQYKNNNINIENDGKIAICNSPELYKNHFVICEQKIPKNGCFSFSFKIGGWVMIGVCDKQKILEQKYIAQFEQSYGHGCYLIENDGTLYSSLKIEKNSEKAFSYTEYDIVSVLIDMDQKLIKWKKLNKTENFEMKIETSDDLYPCIGLGQAWVEII